MLLANNLSKKLRGKRIIDSCTFAVQRGEIVGIFGPNGAGKTTSFYMMAGLLLPDSGTIYLDQQEVTKLPLAARARLGLAYLPQESSVFGAMSVQDNILTVLEIINFPAAKRQERAVEVMQQLQLIDLANAQGSTLSGGERRRVEIARCWAMQPRYILLDEPTAGLDPIAVHDLRNLIKGLAHLGAGVIITDHNVKDIMPIIDRAYVMYQGKVVAAGTPTDIVRNDFVQRIYLGTE